MPRITVSGEIDAPPEVVFDAITNIERLPEVNEDVLRVEFLGDRRSGVGTRFRETRRMGKREMETELEVTEHMPHERARMVTDSHGTVWDTTFTIRPTERGAHLEVAMDARPHALIQRVLTPLMKPVFRRGLEGYVATLQAHCAALHARRA